MGNQICLALHGGAGDEVIADTNAHIFHYENGAASAIARVQMHGVPTENGELPLDAILDAVRPQAYYYPRTVLIAVENTHNRHGGTVLSMDYLQQLRELADTIGLPVHCDGARVWNACIATGVDHQTMGSHFDTLSVCLSKALGAPIGSLVLGTRQNIERARRWRKMLGGGLRQSGVLAAAAMYALDNVLPLLPRDHDHAQMFAQALDKIPGITLDMWRVQSNIVMFRVPMSDADFVSELLDRGVRVAPIKPSVMRAVFYHQITAVHVLSAVEAIADVVARAA
jgi:threonine aldolase